MPTLDELAQAGLTAINDGRYNDAIESFQQALALAPDRPDMNNALGMAYLHRGEAGTVRTARCGRRGWRGSSSTPGRNRRIADPRRSLRAI